MIPLRDNAAPRRLTPINAALIAANIAVFVYELSLGARIAGFVDRFALVPAAVTRALTAATTSHDTVPSGSVRRTALRSLAE